MKNEQPGITEKTLKQFGKIIPGLNGLLEVIKTSPALSAKLKATDEEIEKKLSGSGGGKSSGFKNQERFSKEAHSEPRIEIFDEDDYLRVILEIPGLNEKELELQLNDNSLLISSGNFCQPVSLPSQTKSISNYTYRNGILEVKILK